uniref:Uncharacterized protein n=1 Tax=Heliothis virescens TaxID=7102 RepID=A0A2A4JXR5_HELVI
MKMFHGTSLLLCDNPTPIFKCFVRLIERLKLQDGVKSSAYYGEIKKIITGFMNYFTFTIDDVIKRIDKYTHTLDNKLFVKLIDETITTYQQNQAAFLKEYLPLNNDVERTKYKQVIDGQAKYLQELRAIRTAWEFRQDRLEEFAKECFEESMKKVHYLCTFAHTYLSVMLADRLYELAVSLEETVDRMNTNMRKYNEQCTNKMNALIHHLYDMNKEHLAIYRRHRKRTIDTAEVTRSIEVLREKIEQYGNEETIARLELETRYWNKRLIDFNEIATILTKIRFELDHLEADIEKYNSIMEMELPGAKTVCFDLIGENLRERIAYLHSKQLEMSKTLITFFCVRGTDRILYTDSVGSYYCDEFNHQNYITNFGLKFFHVNCYGEFSENLETEPYYFDENGRYILRDGEKFHQCAPCTSEYKLGENGLFKKVTQDCGHSERVNPDCRLEIKDLTDVVILPKNTDLIDMSDVSLDAESVKYLWDNFGMILPEVLNEVANRQPKNPIHYMAHILLKRRFESTHTEFRELRRKASEYRMKFYRERREKAAEERRAWKAKQVSRAKPEVFDDSAEQAHHSQHAAALQFLSTTQYYG